MEDQASSGLSSESGVGTTSPGTMQRIFSKGILFALAGVLALTIADTCLSILTKNIDPLLLIVYFSPLVAVISFAFIFTLKLKPPSGKRAFAILALYGVSYCVGMNCIIGAVGRMPVADAISIVYCAPVFTAVLGCLVLRQLLRIFDILLIAVCVAGVVLIARPSFLSGEATTRGQVEIIGILMAVGGAFFQSLGLICVSKLTREGVDRLWAMAIGMTSTFMGNVGLCFVFGKWDTPDPLYYLAIIVLYAACNFLAQLFLFTALSSERAANVSVIMTSEIALLFVLQIFLLKISSNWLTIAGALLVTASCVGMMLHRNDNRSVEPLHVTSQ